MNKKEKFYSTCDKLSLVAISLFALECVLGSSGRWLNFGNISIRIALFIVCFLVTLPNVFRTLRSLSRNLNLILTVLFGVYLILAAIIGWQSGNNLSYIAGDISSFLALALLPGFLTTICTRERASRMIDIVFYGSVALSVITVALHFFFAFASNWQINTINNWLNDHSIGGLASMVSGMQRIYMKSQIFLQVGLLLGLQKIWCQKGYVRWLLFAAEGFLAYACLMTYTRGFWLGFAISACITLVLSPKQWKRYLSTLGITTLLLVGLFLLSFLAYGKPVAAYELVNRFDPDLISGALFLPDASGPSDTEDPSQDASSAEPSLPTDPNADQAAVLLRQETLRMLGKKISAHPVFGNGLGTSLEGVRDGGRVEYMYYDILMKVGAVGFVLFCAVFFLPVLPLLKNRVRWLSRDKQIPWESLESQNTVLMTSYIGVAITSYLNPFLINPMGILLVMLITAAARQEQP